MYKTLVLSGGSVKGVGVLGALQYIDSISSLADIDQFYGTSVGALLSVLLAIGANPIELFAYFLNFNFIVRPEFAGNDMKIIEYQGFIDAVEAIIRAKCGGEIPTLREIFKKYGKKVFVTTYNYSESSIEVLSYLTRPHMKCSDAVKLSCAIPFIFGRVIYEDKLYFDGGLVCNFPLNIAFKRRATNVIAINLRTPTERATNDSLLTIFFHLLFAPIDHRVQEIVKKYAARCTYIELRVDIPFTKFKLNAAEAAECFYQGYNVARATLRGLK